VRRDGPELVDPPSEGQRDTLHRFVIVVEEEEDGCFTGSILTERGKQRLQEYGIVPPHPSSTAECPQGGSADTQETSRFGSTPCKARWRCNACQEPFDRFKCH
jgi:ring-1,2-phenylacetyl-CoA epoxidase subunit PaaD